MSYQDLNATFRPIDVWPGEETANRKPASFRAPWKATLELLKKELRHLWAERIVCQVALRERDIRNDGYPRGDARAFHPGVILSFDSKHGFLKYACDNFDHWEDNIRAIALGMSDLRRLERFGITKRGEQYTGWKQLPASTQPAISTEAAAAFVSRHAAQRPGATQAAIVGSAQMAAAAYRTAAGRLHPDAGGSVDDFQLLQEAKRVLDAHHGGAR